MGPDFEKRVKTLMAERGVSAGDLCAELGLGKSVFSDWGRGKATPSLKTAAKIAQFFECPVDYLAFGEKPSPEANPITELSARQKALLDRFDRMAPEYQDRMISYADGMLSMMPSDGTDNGGL